MITHKTSYSRIAKYQKCPKAYWFQYVAGAGDLAAGSNRPAYIGKRLHQFIAEYAAQLHANQERTNEENGKKILNRIVEETITDECAEQVRDLGDQFLDRYEAQLSDVCEQELFVDAEWEFENANFYIRGYIDNLQITRPAYIEESGETGRILIIDDWKTGYKQVSADGSDQLAIYAALAYRKYIAAYPEILPEITLRIYDARMGRNSQVKITIDQANERLQKYMDLAVEIANATEYPTRPSPDCAMCDFMRYCPAIEKTEIAERVQKWIEIKQAAKDTEADLKAEIRSAGGQVSIGSAVFGFYPHSSLSYDGPIFLQAYAKAVGLDAGILAANEFHWSRTQAEKMAKRHKIDLKEFAEYATTKNSQKFGFIGSDSEN